MSKIDMKMEIVPIDNPNEFNFILGQSHFIKTSEDLYEVCITSGFSIKFGFAFCEASGPRLIRYDGNDQELIELAKQNAMKIGAGHSFILFMKDCFPISILNQVKMIQEVCHIFCATANPTQVIVGKSDLGRGILGVIDGGAPLGFETSENQKERKSFLRNICKYKK